MTRPFIYFVDPDKDFCTYMVSSLSGHRIAAETVRVAQGTFQDLAAQDKFDCLVAPGNSFGIMDGGMDLEIRDYFGLAIEKAVQAVIHKEFKGECPVGCAFVVLTKHPRIEYLCYTPTMRVPSQVPGEHSYTAMRAALMAIEREGDIKSMAVPALCTGTGLVHPAHAAHAMGVALATIEYGLNATDWHEVSHLVMASRPDAFNDGHTHEAGEEHTH